MTKNPLTDKHRWLLVKHRLSKKKALASRAEEIRFALAEIEDRRRELKELRKQPLPTFTEEYVAVFPGDPRYQKAETLFDPKKYTGTWKFFTLP